MSPLFSNKASTNPEFPCVLIALKNSLIRRQPASALLLLFTPETAPILAARPIEVIQIDTLKVKRLRPNARLPERATDGSSGLDLFACIEGADHVVLGRRPVRVGTGIAIEFPWGFDVQVRPRSGLALKGVGVTLGTIDSDYRGEVLVTMYLFGDTEEYRINSGDRIAQLVVSRLGELPVIEVGKLSDTARGSGGHGSTGQ